jgi:hypothetical protein
MPGRREIGEGSKLQEDIKEAGKGKGLRCRCRCCSIEGQGAFFVLTSGSSRTSSVMESHMGATLLRSSLCIKV